MDFGPCERYHSEDLKEDFANVTWVSVNISDDKNGYAEKYSVKVVPTIAVEWNGRVEKHSGTNVSGYYRILRLTQKQ
jgi:hypothetical protein